MYSSSTTLPTVVFFVISYSLILLPLIVILKSNSRFVSLQLNQLQSKDNICSFFLIIFFIISGLPLTNVFLFKWMCLLNIFNSGNYYISIVFILVNLFSILIYYNVFFNRLLVMSLTESVNYVSNNTMDQYYINMYILFSLYFNFFGFLLINIFISLV